MSSAPRADGICATSRFLPFPRMEVFAAFSDANRLAAWWGPDGFTNTFERFEFEPQGRWTFVMHGPGGVSYPNECVFLDVSPTKVVIQHTCAPHFTLTVTLEDAEGGTLIHWSQAFPDPQVAASIWHVIEPSNEQNLNRLEAVLSAQPNA